MALSGSSLGWKTLSKPAWRQVGSPWGARAGPGPEKPPFPHFDAGSFGAIFGHFGMFFVFFSEPVFQDGFGTVFYDFGIIFDFILASF